MVPPLDVSAKKKPRESPAGEHSRGRARAVLSGWAPPRGVRPRRCDGTQDGPSPRHLRLEGRARGDYLRECARLATANGPARGGGRTPRDPGRSARLDRANGRARANATRAAVRWSTPPSSCRKYESGAQLIEEFNVPPKALGSIRVCRASGIGTRAAQPTNCTCC